MKVPAYLQPFFISVWIAGMCTALGYNSGAILNPARDVAPRLFTALVGYGWQPFQPLNGHYW
jgi:glycerol uptake facilitator-like aquaporin